MDVHYCVRSASIVADVVEDEAVILDLESGAYFSLQGFGCDVWQMLAAGHTASAVLAAVLERYIGDEAAMRSNVESLIQELVEEGLLLAADGGPPDDGLITLEPIAEPRHYVMCSLRKFDDMQSLLLLDPVHDVDPTGWPNANAGG